MIMYLRQSTGSCRREFRIRFEKNRLQSGDFSDSTLLSITNAAAEIFLICLKYFWQREHSFLSLAYPRVRNEWNWIFPGWDRHLQTPGASAEEQEEPQWVHGKFPHEGVWWCLLSLSCQHFVFIIKNVIKVRNYQSNHQYKKKSLDYFLLENINSF